MVRRTLETGIASSSTLIGTAAFSETGHGDIENEPVAAIFSGRHTARRAEKNLGSERTELIILGNVCRVGARRMQSDDRKVPGELLGRRHEEQIESIALHDRSGARDSARGAGAEAGAEYRVSV